MITTRHPMWRFTTGVAGYLALAAALCLGVIASIAFVMAGPAAGSIAQDGEPQAARSAVAPEIALLVSGITAEDQEAIVGRLNRIEGVARATADASGDGTAVFYIARTVEGGARPVAAITGDAETAIAALFPASDVLIGGSAVVDGDLSARFGRSAVAVAIVGLLLGGALGLVFGWKRGAASAAVLFIAVLCAGSIGTQISGGFDGTVTTTALPGALGGLLAGSAVAIRLLFWFREPGHGSGYGTGDSRAARRVGQSGQPDGADLIRRSVTHLLPELSLIFFGMLVAAMLVELLNAGRSPLTVVTLSAAVAVLVVLAVLAPTLTILQAEPEARSDWLPFSIADGRDFPLLVLSAIALVLIALSLFAFGTPHRSLLDGDRLSGDAEAVIVADRLANSGGDATSALVASNPGTIEPADFAAWVEVIAERPEVAWIDSATERRRATGLVDTAASALLVAPGDDRLVIVMNSSPRSEDGQQAAADLAAIPVTGGPVTLTGAPIDAAGVAGSRGPVVVALLALAAVGALAIYVLTQNKANAISAAVLRLIGGGATLGVFRLMANDATMGESLTILAVVALGLGLFELEFLRAGMDRGLGGTVTGMPTRLDLAADRGSVSDGSDDEPAVPNAGQSAAIAMGALGVGALLVALTAPFGGGPGTGQFGLGLFVALTIELLIGIALLRPAILGQRAAFHTAARPVRIALHAGNDRQTGTRLAAEDPVWRRTVGDLLQAEFRFQSEPSAADLDAVFVRDTPLHRQADTHHRNLADAGLRIVGRSPQLRSLKTVSGRSPIILAVTVDHPIRHLVDADGKVVGVRKPERRSGVLWLAAEDDGSYRIAESVELGSVVLQEDKDLSADDPDDLDETDGPGLSAVTEEHLSQQ